MSYHSQPPNNTGDLKRTAPNHDSHRKTLWVGNIEPWMDERAIATMFGGVTHSVSIKLMKDKLTAVNLNYAFAEFDTPETANRAYNQLNGQIHPKSNKPIRLNWASFKPANRSRLPVRKENEGHSVYVGDLEIMTSKAQLFEFFRKEYGSVLSANIITDPNTGLSKGYGFVQFGSRHESALAIRDMNGTMFRGSRIKVNPSQKKKSDKIAAKQASESNKFNNYFGGLGVQLAGKDPSLPPTVIPPVSLTSQVSGKEPVSRGPVEIILGKRPEPATSDLSNNDGIPSQLSAPRTSSGIVHSKLELSQSIGSKEPLFSKIIGVYEDNYMLAGHAFMMNYQTGLLNPIGS